jgi:hypothetical protein
MSFSVQVGAGGNISDQEAAILKRKRIGDMVERILRDVVLELGTWESGFLETLIPDTYDLEECLPNPVRVICCQQAAL